MLPREVAVLLSEVNSCFTVQPAIHSDLIIFIARVEDKVFNHERLILCKKYTENK